MNNEKSNIGTKVWSFINMILDFILRKVLHLKIENEQWDTLIQFVKFGIVGLSNTIISYVIYVIVLIMLQRNQLFFRWDYLAAQVVAFILSVLWSFYWNNKYVFQLNSKSIQCVVKALVKTYISYAFTGLVLNNILSLLLVEILQINKLLAPLINLLISVPINFFLNKFWAFRKSR